MDFIIGHGDAWQYLWNFWWFKTALFDLHTSPFFTHLLHWPVGISLLFQTFSLTNTLAAIPLQAIFGLPATYNILLLLGAGLTFFSTYALVVYVVKNRGAALVAAFIVTFSPFRFTHYLGHLDLVHFQWVPLYILYLLKMRDQKSDWKMPALFVVLTAYTNLYYLFYEMLFTALFFLFNMQKRRLALNLAVMALASGIVIVPYVGTMIYANHFISDFQVLGHDPVALSTPISSFFIPNRFSPFQNTEGAAYLGVVAVMLALYGLWKQRDRATAMWTACGLAFAILSLGPAFPPYAILNRIVPLFSLSGVPGRMNAMTFLALGMLAAYGVAAIKIRRSFIIVTLIAMIAIEYVPSSFALSSVDIPPFYEQLRRDSARYAILDVSDNEAKVLYYQTIHGKPMIGGYTTRPTKSSTEFLNALRIPVLARYDVRYVLIAKSDTFRADQLNQIGFPVAYEDDKMTVFMVE